MITRKIAGVTEFLKEETKISVSVGVTCSQKGIFDWSYEVHILIILHVGVTRFLKEGISDPKISFAIF